MCNDFAPVTFKIEHFEINTYSLAVNEKIEAKKSQPNEYGVRIFLLRFLVRKIENAISNRIQFKNVKHECVDRLKEKQK